MAVIKHTGGKRTLRISQMQPTSPMATAWHTSKNHTPSHMSITLFARAQSLKNKSSVCTPFFSSAAPDFFGLSARVYADDPNAYC